MLTPASKQRLIHQTQAFLLSVQQQPAVADCLQCEHWHDGYCEQFSSNPPESFYLTDCDSWLEKIPF